MELNLIVDNALHVVVLEELLDGILDDAGVQFGASTDFDNDVGHNDLKLVGDTLVHYEAPVVPMEERCGRGDLLRMESKNMHHSESMGRSCPR